jgi:ATP-binding cassette subfamily F protein 3
MIIISHDRDLLDTAVDSILSLEGRKLALYRGGYSAFERARAERLALDQKLAKKQEAQRQHLQAFVDRFRAKATKARQAQSRLKMLEKLEPIATLTTEDVRPIVIPPPERRLSPPIVALDNVAVGYAPGKPVLKGLALRIDDDDRIALIGQNGNGKSTLVKLIAERLAPLSGKMTRADRLRVAYFAQHQLDELEPGRTIYDHIRVLMPEASESSVRARAGAIGFSGEAADTDVERLSGGEKARLMLGLATFGGPHLLILDEPTNHLDIDSRAALIQAINDYPGATIIVSHDRHLLDACADRLWLVAGGKVTPFQGDLGDYQREILSDRREAADGARRGRPARAGRSEARRIAADRRAETAPLRKRLAALETEIARLTRQIAEFDAILSDGSLFGRDPGKAAALAKARSDCVEALAQAEEDWLAAGEALQSASA